MVCTVAAFSDQFNLFFQRLLRHDVEPVARIVVAPFEIEQLFVSADGLCGSKVNAAAHDMGFLAWTYIGLQRRLTVVLD